MRYRSALICLVSAALLSACGGGAEDAQSEPTPTVTVTADSEPPQATSTPTEDPTYALADRETFLATGPDCDALQNWYEQFPADTDGATALRYIEQCQEAPAPVLDGSIFPGSNERLMRALFAPEVAGPSRAAAHEAVARGVCDLFGTGTRSMHLIGTTVKDFGGTPKDYAAVVDASLRQCPSSKADLTVFTTRDVLSATAKYKKALKDAGADLTLAASDEEIAALAAVTCISLRDGESMDSASLLLTSFVDSDSEASRLGALGADLFCPAYA